jgi:DNA-directed RNA polymerase subunit H (RpoH/RPB5)
MRNNPKASLLNLSNVEKRQILSDAAIVAAEYLDLNEDDPVFREAVKIAGKIIGL